MPLCRIAINGLHGRWIIQIYSDEIYEDIFYVFKIQSIHIFSLEINDCCSNTERYCSYICECEQCIQSLNVGAETWIYGVFKEVAASKTYTCLFYQCWSMSAHGGRSSFDMWSLKGPAYLRHWQLMALLMTVQSCMGSVNKLNILWRNDVVKCLVACSFVQMASKNSPTHQREYICPGSYEDEYIVSCTIIFLTRFCCKKK